MRTVRHVFMIGKEIMLTGASTPPTTINTAAMLKATKRRLATRIPNLVICMPHPFNIPHRIKTTGKTPATTTTI